MLVQAGLAIAFLMILVAISLQTRPSRQGGWAIPVALGTVGGLLAGLALGAVGMAYYWEWTEDVTGLSSAPPRRFLPGAMPAGPMTSPFAPGGPTGGPNPKTQLLALVRKLDQLVDRPLKLELDDEAKATIRTQLDGVEKLAELSRDEARKRLDAMLAALGPQRATLEAAGYRWPGGGGGGAGTSPILGPTDPPNPFQEASGSAVLASLQEKLAEP